MQKGNKKIARILALIASLNVVVIAGAQEVQHLNVTQPGGFPGLPMMTGIESASNGVTVKWEGPSGYYQVFQKFGLSSPTWERINFGNLDRRFTVTNTVTLSQSDVFFRVAGPSPQYAGSQACAACHESVHTVESATVHAKAYETLAQIGQGANPSCLPCHTVGFGLPTGFTSAGATPHLKGVQCENCHGPAANHAANETDLTVRPRIEIASQVCGGCHTGSHHPTYDEWASSGHSQVVEDMRPSGRINSCGRCHSGSVQLALAGGMPASAVTTNLANDANVGITCVVCHDPHQNHTWINVLTGVKTTNQLRYAVASTNDFVLTTSDNFTNKNDPNINICAQCHNHRGASATATGRPPHHSPQYNMLLGTVGVRLDGSTNARPAAHALQIEKQCVGCHMPTKGYQSETNGAFTGHTFKVELSNTNIPNTCLPCHPFPEGLVDLTASIVSNRINQVTASLNLWGETKSKLRNQYGPLSWEYSIPGDLSTGTNSPPASLQTTNYIPAGIMNARFNLYLVKYDGSYGTHNPFYILDLLDAADYWVQQQPTNNLVNP
jgi:hypothetical protein